MVLWPSHKLVRIYMEFLNTRCYTSVHGFCFSGLFFIGGKELIFLHMAATCSIWQLSNTHIHSTLGLLCWNCGCHIISVHTELTVIIQDLNCCKPNRTNYCSFSSRSEWQSKMLSFLLNIVIDDLHGNIFRGLIRQERQWPRSWLGFIITNS